MAGKLVNGRWRLGAPVKRYKGRYSFRVTDTFSGEIYERAAGTTSRKAAEQSALDFIRQVEEQERAPDIAPGVTFGEAFREYLKLRAETTRPSTYRDYLCSFESIYEPAFGSTLIAGIAPADIERFIAKRAKERSLSPKSQHKMLSELRSFGGWCVRSRLLPTNFCGDLKRKRGTRRAGRPLTIEEARRLITAASTPTVVQVAAPKDGRAPWKQETPPPPYLRLALLTALYTGLRRGSMLSLEWKEIDLRNGWLVRGEEAQKDAREIRLPIHPVLLAELRLARRGSRSGKVFPVASITSAFESTRTRAGLEGIRWHDLRHTYSNWLRLRTSQAVKDCLMGHSPAGISGVYEHPGDSELVEAIASLPDLTLDTPLQAEETPPNKVG